MLKQSRVIALSFVFLLVLGFLNLPERITSQVKFALGSLFLPLLSLASSAQGLAETGRLAALPRRNLIQHIQDLSRENEQLKLELLQAAEVWRENKELRQAVQWQQQIPWQLRLGRVIMRDPANWRRSVRINLGSADGIRTNYAVLSTNGLVGRISEVWPRASQVLLIGDPDCPVAAMLEKSRDHGILEADRGAMLDSKIIQLRFLPRQTQIEPGQRVITSGLGGIFPPGIVIGEILDANSVQFGLHTTARVKLAADLDHLERVWVVQP